MAHKQGIKIYKGKFIIVCSIEWPALNFRYPPAGPFDAGLFGDVEDIVFRLLVRHPHQIPILYTITIL